MVRHSHDTYHSHFTLLLIIDSKTIRHPPTEEVFLERIQMKTKHTSDEFATYLLDDVSRNEFRNELKTPMGVANTHRMRFIMLFNMWKRTNYNFTWDHAIMCLKHLREIKIAKDLQNSYDRDVFDDNSD